MPAIQDHRDVGRRGTFENLVAAIAQIARDDHPDQDVGLDDQNGAGYSTISVLII